MRIVILSLMLLAGCDVLQYKGLAQCEAAIKDQLRSPSTYKRIDVRDQLVVERGQGLKVRRFEIDYDADNAFGAPIRADAVCEFEAKSGDFIEVAEGPRSLARSLGE